MKVFANPLRGAGIAPGVEMARGALRTDPAPVRALLTECPAHAPTPLLSRPDLAQDFGVAALHLKDERPRMGLGSFKALGGAYAVACLVRDHAPGGLTSPTSMEAASAIRVICASAGNHGLSVAAGARVFGARAAIYLSESVPESFADRLRGQGADVVRAGTIYEESMSAAADAAERGEGVLISDSTWPGYVDPALTVMEGYTVLAAEAAEAMDAPTHIFLQAGVGGLASALAATFRSRWGDAPTIVVVEPEAAPCLMESVRAGRPVAVEGPVSNMGRLDCKQPSHVALECLAREADAFVTLSDAEVAGCVDRLAGAGLASTPSGAAGLAALMLADRAARAALGLDTHSSVLAVISEAAVDG